MTSKTADQPKRPGEKLNDEPVTDEVREIIEKRLADKDPGAPWTEVKARILEKKQPHIKS